MVRVVPVVLVFVVVIVGGGEGRQLHVRSDPMADLAPFGIGVRRSVGIGEGDC